MPDGTTYTFSNHSFAFMPAGGGEATAQGLEASLGSLRLRSASVLAASPGHRSLRASGSGVACMSARQSVGSPGAEGFAASEGADAGSMTKRLASLRQRSALGGSLGGGALGGLDTALGHSSQLLQSQTHEALQLLGISRRRTQEEGAVPCSRCVCVVCGWVGGWQLGHKHVLACL